MPSVRGDKSTEGDPVGTAVSDRHCACWLTLTLLAAVVPARARADESSARRPNIVVLLADDLEYGELSCQDNPPIPTPHIDSISSNGIRFTNGYVTAAFLQEC